MADNVSGLKWLTGSFGENIGTYSTRPEEIKEFLTRLSSTIGVPVENLFLNEPTIIGEGQEFWDTIFPETSSMGVYARQPVPGIRGKNVHTIAIDNEERATNTKEDMAETRAHETSHLYDHLFGGPRLKKPQLRSSDFLGDTGLERWEAAKKLNDEKRDLLDEFDSPINNHPKDKWMVSPEYYDQALDSSITGFGHFGGGGKFSPGTDVVHANYEFDAMRDSWDRQARTMSPSEIWPGSKSVKDMTFEEQIKESKRRQKLMPMIMADNKEAALKQKFLNNPRNIERFGSNLEYFEAMATAVAKSQSDVKYEKMLNSYSREKAFDENGRQVLSIYDYLNSPSERWARYYANTLDPSVGVDNFMPNILSKPGTRQRQRDALGYYLNRESENERKN